LVVYFGLADLKIEKLKIEKFSLKSKC